MGCVGCAAFHMWFGPGGSTQGIHFIFKGRTHDSAQHDNGLQGLTLLADNSFTCVYIHMHEQIGMDISVNLMCALMGRS